MVDINKMNRDELIAYAREFNIHKHYDFPEYLDVKNQILQKMTELDVSIDDVDPMKIRTVHPDYYTVTINNI
jgi:hypothetical protein